MMKLGYKDADHLDLNYGLSLRLVTLATLSAFFALAEDVNETARLVATFTCLVLIADIVRNFVTNFGAKSVDHLRTEYNRGHFFLFSDSKELRTNFLYDAFNRFALVYSLLSCAAHDSDLLSFIISMRLSDKLDDMIFDDSANFYGARLER